MTEGISLPPGAFAAMKSGAPQPPLETPKAPANTEPSPKTMTRKASPPKETLKESASPPEMTEAQKKIWKLKDGEEEFEFDASDEEAVKREIMKARGSDRRFKDAAALRKQAETFFEMLKDGKSVRKVLEDPRIGVDFIQLAKQAVWEQMQEEQMTPEQRAQRDRDREYEELKAEKLRSAQEKEQQESAARQAVWEADYEKKIIAALEVKGVPRDHQTVMRMAHYLEKAIEHGHDLSADEIAQLVKNDTGSYLKTYADALTEEQFLEFLGEQNAKKLRNADLKRLKSPQRNPFPERTRPKPGTKQQQPKKLSGTDWKKDAIEGFLARK